MVAGLPKTRAGSDEDRAALASAAAALADIRQTLTGAIDADAAAYDRVVAAYKRPKASADEQASRAAAIQQALRDVSDALVAYRKGRDFREQEELLARSASDARRLADLRYQGGATSYLEVLDSDSRLFSAELSLADAQLSELLALVQIYRSLGGGWEM
jgi:multidrug efflux system outer membrane protein